MSDLAKSMRQTNAAKTAAAVQLLKRAAFGSAGKVIGKAAKGVGALVRGAGEFGAGVAEGAGIDPALGRIAGVAGAGAAGVNAAGKTKRKIDEWRYTHGLY